MNTLSRISLLCGAVVLLVFGVVCLKQQLGGKAPTPPSSNPNAVENAARSSVKTYPPPMPEQSRDEGDLGSPPREFSPEPLAQPAPIPGVESDEPPTFAGTSTVLPGGTSSIPASRNELPAVSPAILLAPTPTDPSTGGRSTVRPIPEFVEMIETVADDSLWRISERVYGTGEFYKALYVHNRALLPRPDRIPPHMRLATPAISELRQLYPEVCPPDRANSVPQQ